MQISILPEHNSEHLWRNMDEYYCVKTIQTSRVAIIVNMLYFKLIIYIKAKIQI